jgi:hypothetical protein
MQEDNLEKRLGDSLRRQQEESLLPYELGAWEAFEKRRAALVRRKTSYWMAGIAASLLLVLVAGGIWLGQQENGKGSGIADLIATTGIPNPSDSTASAELIADARQSDLIPAPNSSEGSSIAPIASKSPRSNSKTRQGSTASGDTGQLLVGSEGQKNVSRTAPAAIQNSTELNEAVAAAGVVISPADSMAESKETLSKEPLLTQEEIEEILGEDPSWVNLILGLTPGFGTSQGAQLATSGSSIGLGVMVDTRLTGKLSVGSGLGVNYLNQASESQSYPQVAGISSPVVQTDQITQVQVDIPLYVRYPITRSQSVSVQAGFSNLLTFNQNAEQQTSFTRQVPVQDVTSNSIMFKTQTVDQLSALEVPQSKFYPFATANFGINVRLYQSKKTSYEVMPFYNYPLQEFSGYGQKLGLFGASFRVNFGAVERK